MTQFSAFDIPNVIALAQHLGRPIAFFDLETSSLVGAKNFGITEIGVWRVMPDGSQGSFTRLVNPENWIPPEVEAITGITAAMVENESPFAAQASTMSAILQSYLPVGFNIRTFDVPGLHSQYVRYGLPVPAHAPILDLRDAWIGIHQPPRGKGKLVEVAEHYGCPFTGAHRAMSDTIGCVHVLEAMLVQHGQERILNYLRSSELPPERTANASGPSSTPKWVNAARDADKIKAREAILKIISDLGRWDLDYALATSGITKPAPFSFAMADLLQEGLVSAEQASHSGAQEWLDVHWENVVSPDLRLKPMLDNAQNLGAASHVDYIQLRVALIRRTAPSMAELASVHPIPPAEAARASAPRF